MGGVVAALMFLGQVGIPGLAVPYGLGTAACWGVSDFMATQAARKFPFGLVAMLLVTSVSSTIVLTLALPTGIRGGARILGLLPLWALMLLVIIAVLEAGGHLMLYVAFARGPLALVAPIATSSPAVAALLSLADGYRANLILLLGASLLFSSAVLASVERSHQPSLVLVQIPAASSVWLLSDSLQRNLSSQELQANPPVLTVPVPSRRLQSWRLLTTPGVKPAIVASLVQGIGFFLLLYLPSNLGGIVSTWLIFAVGTLFLILLGSSFVVLVVWRRRAAQGEIVAEQGQENSPLLPRASIQGLVSTYGRLGVVGVLDAIAFLSYSAGQHAGVPVLTAGLASLATVITVLLAVALLREGLSRQQWLGVVCAVAGLVLASIGGAL